MYREIDCLVAYLQRKILRIDLYYFFVLDEEQKSSGQREREKKAEKKDMLSIILILYLNVSSTGVYYLFSSMSFYRLVCSRLSHG